MRTQTQKKKVFYSDLIDFFCWLIGSFFDYYFFEYELRNKEKIWYLVGNSWIVESIGDGDVDVNDILTMCNQSHLIEYEFLNWSVDYWFRWYNAIQFSLFKNLIQAIVKFVI